MSGAIALPSGPVALIRPTTRPQSGPFAGSGHGPMRTCAMPEAVSQVPITVGDWAEAVEARAPRSATRTSFLILPPLPPSGRPGELGQDIGRQPAVDLAPFGQRPAVERSDDAPRRFGRTFHVRHQIVHDAGARMQLAIGELLQDDRAQELVVGRRHRNGGRPPHPRARGAAGEPPNGRAARGQKAPAPPPARPPPRPRVPPPPPPPRLRLVHPPTTPH